jgi:hypothetical protein
MGTSVRIPAAMGDPSLLLTAVHDHGPPIRVPQPRGEAFTLLFQGTASLQQGTYIAEHSSLGRFSLFLVPHGKPGAGQPAGRFSATFTRI